MHAGRRRNGKGGGARRRILRLGAPGAAARFSQGGKRGRSGAQVFRWIIMDVSPSPSPNPGLGSRVATHGGKDVVPRPKDKCRTKGCKEGNQNTRGTMGTGVAELRISACG